MAIGYLIIYFKALIKTDHVYSMHFTFVELDTMYDLSYSTGNY